MGAGDWYIGDESETLYGPMAFAEVKKLVDERVEIPDEAYVWKGPKPSARTLRLVGEIRPTEDEVFEFLRAAMLLLRAADRILQGDRFLERTDPDLGEFRFDGEALNSRIDRWEIAKRAWNGAYTLDRRLSKLLSEDPLSLNSFESEIENNCAYLVYDQDDDSAAVDYITVFLDRINRYDLPLFWRGLSFLRIGQIEEGFRDFDSAHKDGTNNMFGIETGGAIELLEALWMPGYWGVSNGWRLSLYAVGFFLQLKAVVDRHPNNCPAIFVLTEFYLRLGSPPQLILENLLKLHQDSTEWVVQLFHEQLPRGLVLELLDGLLAAHSGCEKLLKLRNEFVD